MKKVILIIVIIIISLALINLCTDDKPKAKKEYKVTLADGTVCEWFEVRYEMYFIGTSRQLHPDQYQAVADSFHFPKTKMIYFHLDNLRGTGEQYGTLYHNLVLPVKNFNPDSLKLLHNE